MKSKEELLQEAVESFPEFYFSRKEMNPDFIFKPGKKFQPIHKIVVHRYLLYDGKNLIIYPNPCPKDKPIPIPDDDINREELAVTIFTSTRKREKLTIFTECRLIGDDVQCEVVGHPKNTAHYIEKFVEYFFFEFLSAKEITPNQWNLWNHQCGSGF